MDKSIQDIVEKIEKLTVIELAELVKTLEEKFGVNLAYIPQTPAQAQTSQETQQAPSAGTVNVILQAAGDQKVQVIKVLREINPSWSLKDAKDIVDSAPKVIKEGISMQEAEELKKKLEAVGAKVEIK
jgi:large subunit ribosomal protein L7/L12